MRAGTPIVFEDPVEPGRIVTQLRWPDWFLLLVAVPGLVLLASEIRARRSSKPSLAT